jgi:hypothetical protein
VGPEHPDEPPWQPRDWQPEASARVLDGTCLGGPVSDDYYDRAPFPFDGKIDTVTVRYSS